MAVKRRKRKTRKTSKQEYLIKSNKIWANTKKRDKRNQKKVLGWLEAQEKANKKFLKSIGFL